MPPRRKRLDINVMSSIVSERPILPHTTSKPHTASGHIISHTTSKHIISHTTSKHIISHTTSKKPIVSIKSKLIKKRRRKPIDSSSSGCDTPPESEYLPVITETPEKTPIRQVCYKCFNYIDLTVNYTEYVIHGKTNYIHNVCPQ